MVVVGGVFLSPWGIAGSLRETSFQVLPSGFEATRTCLSLWFPMHIPVTFIGKRLFRLSGHLEKVGLIDVAYT